MSRVLEWLLRVWSGLLALSAVLWIFTWVTPYGLPGRVYDFVIFGFGPTRGLASGVTMGAYFTDDTLNRIQASTPDDLMLSADQANSLGYQNQGDVNLGWSLQFFPHGMQGAAVVALHVIPLLVMAVLWWWLAGAVAQSRREVVFSVPNARRLTVAGAVVALGGPAVALCTWLVHRWILETSQFADRAQIPSFGTASIPWSVVAAGLALIVLGRVWHKGALKEYELAGLV